MWEKSFEFLRRSVPKKCKRKRISVFYRRFLLFYKIYITNIDIQFDIWTFFYLFHSIKVDYDLSCVIYLSRDGFRTKSNRIEFDCVRLCSIVFDCVRVCSIGSIGSIVFENRTNSKIDVRFCSITEPNRTIGVRLGSIDFWFDFVRSDTPGNVHRDADLDNSGGKIETKKTVKLIEDLMSAFNLVDIWRIRKRFTWRQRKPFIQRRIDYTYPTL